MVKNVNDNELAINEISSLLKDLKAGSQDVATIKGFILGIQSARKEEQPLQTI